MKYTITSKFEEMDFALIHDFLRQTYWSKNIPAAVLKKGLENSLCFGIFEDGKQLGFARTITDRSTFAYLADVFILAEHRGRGLSKHLLDAVFEHPDLQGLRRKMLATADAHGLYTKYGFTPLKDATIVMENWVPDIYQADDKHD